MTKAKIYQFPIVLQKAPFSRKKAEEYGLSPARLRRLFAKGIIEKVAYGIYRIANRDLSVEDQFVAATLKAGKNSAICLLSALAYYDLTDEIPDKVWIMVPAKCHLPAKELQLLRVAKPHWKIGIKKQRGFKITNIERSIVEALIRRRQMGTRIGIDALRAALLSEQTTLDKVYQMAVLLGLEKRVVLLLEMLA